MRSCRRRWHRAEADICRDERIGKRLENTYDQIKCTKLKNEDLLTFILGRKGNFHKQIWPAIKYFLKPESRRRQFTAIINDKSLNGFTLLGQIEGNEQDSGFRNNNKMEMLVKIKQILVKRFDAKY